MPRRGCSTFPAHRGAPLLGTPARRWRADVSEVHEGHAADLARRQPEPSMHEPLAPSTVRPLGCHTARMERTGGRWNYSRRPRVHLVLRAHAPALAGCRGARHFRFRWIGLIHLSCSALSYLPVKFLRDCSSFLTRASNRLIFGITRMRTYMRRVVLETTFPRCGGFRFFFMRRSRGMWLPASS